MHQDVGVSKAAPNYLPVADVRADELGLGAEVARVSLVDLWVERVEDTHFVAVAEERVNEVRSDEPGAAGDEHSHL